MKTGARIDRRDAELLRWIEAAAQRFGAVHLDYVTNGVNPSLPWQLAVWDGNRGSDYEVLASGRSLREVLETVRKDLSGVRS